MSTEEEQFMALMHESLRAQKDCASIVINYTCYNAHYDYVDTLYFTFNGDDRIDMKQAGDIQPQEVVVLPDELATDEAMRLWQKLQEAGYVDVNYQPTISRPMAALMADAMATHLGIQEKWKTFETLWKRRNMRSDYNRAFTQQQSLGFQETLKNLIR